MLRAIRDTFIILFLIGLYVGLNLRFPQPFPNQIIYFAVLVFILACLSIYLMIVINSYDERIKRKMIDRIETLLGVKADIDERFGCFIRRAEIKGIYKGAQATVSIFFAFWGRGDGSERSEDNKIMITSEGFVKEYSFLRLTSGMKHVQLIFQKLDEELK